MTTDYSKIYPELSPEGQQKTQEIINKFAGQLTELMNNSISDFTQNLAAEIVNDDSWINIRQLTLEALCGYSESERRNKAGGTYLGQWWVTIRKKILDENRDAIINDIINDKDLEIKRLNEHIEYLKYNQ